MDEAERQRFKIISLQHCDRLFNEIKRDQDDIHEFFGGELYKSYVAATDKALTKARNIRMKVRNL